ncbi:MAG: lysylphosphatidylglycerol synthase transmembrane domain-containing protein [Nanoarchaeota archaeon]
MKNLLKRLFKVIFSIALIFILFKLIDLNKVINLIIDIDFKFLFFPAIIFFIGLFLSVKKWKKILEVYGININSSELFKLYLVGSFYNNFLPSTIGGDGYKFIKLNKKYNSKKKEILSSIILERAFGFFTWFVINLVFFFIFFRTIIKNKYLLSLEIFLILGPPFLLILINIFGKYFKIFKGISLMSKLSNLFSTLGIIIRNYKIFFFSFFISIIINALTIFSIYSIFLSFGISVDLRIIAFCMSLIIIYSIIPISLNNIGFTESLSVLVFSIFMIDSAIILSTFLVARFTSILMSLFGGISEVYDSIKK